MISLLRRDEFDDRRIEDRWFFQLVSFLTHLRCSHQALTLSTGYLLGAMFSDDMRWLQYTFWGVVVLFLINGGGSVYNSFFDNDLGPVSGLELPPPMNRWMLWAALGCMLVGVALTALLSPMASMIAASTVVLTILYNGPLIRLKRYPLGIASITISGGANTVLLGYLAAGGAEDLGVEVLLAALGTTLVLLSLYPITQIFQTYEDRDRGDRTFALAYGIRAVRKFLVTTYAIGTVVIAIALELRHRGFGLSFLAVGAAGLLVVRKELAEIDDQQFYGPAMRIRYMAAFLLAVFMSTCVLLIHAPDMASRIFSPRPPPDPAMMQIQ